MKKRKNDHKLKKILNPIIFLALLILGFSCRDDTRQPDDLDQQQINQQDTLENRQVQVRAYTGDITGMNTMGEEPEVTGNVAIRVEGDLVRFTISAENLAPDMMHRQFLVATGNSTTCPGPNADANNDGIVDMNEVAGNAEQLQMIPLHMGPSTLERNVSTYPRSNINGELQFSRTTSLDSIRTAVREGYGVQDFEFSNYIYIIQGIAGEVTLQQTVQREEDFPAHETGEVNIEHTEEGDISPHDTVPVGCAVLTETEVTD